MAILLHPALAAAGALGLQSSMLGLAWNILRVRNHRRAYVGAFSVAALFSVFFSYAAFNIALKQTTRSQEVREQYSAQVIPVLRQYGDIAKSALHSADYQVKRIDAIVEAEKTRGWATIVDEGSGDPVVQGIIDGARNTVASWRRLAGADYTQGPGHGMIANYLESWQDEARKRQSALEKYVHVTDSLNTLLSTGIPVEQQYQMVNSARLAFPQAEFAAVTAASAPRLPDPPLTAGYTETPLNGQQAFAMVLSDLYPMDLLTLFALLLAFAVDFIVVILALAAGRTSSDADLAFEIAEKDAQRRLQKVKLDNPAEYQNVLNQNIARLKAANEYSYQFGQALSDSKRARTRIKMIRTEDPQGQKMPKTGSRLSRLFRRETEEQEVESAV
ncbi:MAG: hypothetical protein HY851_04210 [candidate division Zixibacteria bacterium]|nr:hypothetical protein [candidate division Zixibacteria bacterium]